MTTEDLIELGNSALFNTYNRGDKLFVSGKGVYLTNNDGEEYLDFVSGIATNILGHANEKIVDAVTKQASTASRRLIRKDAGMFLFLRR